MSRVVGARSRIYLGSFGKRNINCDEINSK